MIKARTIFIFFLFLGVSLALNGCQAVMLNPKGMIATDEKHIMIISVVLMLVVVVPVILMSFIFSYRYRESNTKATYSPRWAHSTLLEIICWSIPLVIVITLGIITWDSSHRLDPYKPLDSKEKTLTIQAIALEWKWLFIYPEQNIATVNYVQIPAGIPVQFLITSEGPMNSFHIPQLAGQIYAMAGMQTKLHVLSHHVGDYRGMSSNFSGEGFSGMKFIARVSTKEEFNIWVKSVKQSTQSLTQDAYKELLKPTENHAVTLYSAVAQKLFETAIMKYMMPMSNASAAEESPSYELHHAHHPKVT